MMLLSRKAPLLLARLLLPLLPSLGLGHWRVGDDGLQAGGGGDLGPAGVEPDPDGDLAVLVGPVLDDATGHLGVPHLLRQATPLLGKLEVDEDVLIGEVLVGVEVLAGQEAERTSQAEPGRRLEIRTM